MSAGLLNSFFGAPHQCYPKKSLLDSSVPYSSRKIPRKCRCAERNEWISRGVKFTHLCGRNVELFWKNLSLRSAWVVNCVKEPLTRRKTLVESLAPVWGEGLLLLRCSVFCAVISGIYLLLWYGQSKTKSFIEAKLLPSVCALLSEHIERELDFGKVRRISPLSITLESCSVGPHSEEFSCAELPTVKLRILPFASIKRGKIVIDAILSNPTLLVAQKKDYTWLGIPFSEGFLPRHLSTEDGIDHRTKTRRIAREEAAAHWAVERDDSAKQAAEVGYLVSEGSATTPEDEFLKDNATPSARLATLESFFSIDEKLHWRDHHCMDAGLEYDLKHADLEKSFGSKVPSTSISLWPRILPGPLRKKFKRKVNGGDLSRASIAAKSRILERSASAACAYFQRLSCDEFGNPTQSSEVPDVPLLESERDTIVSNSQLNAPNVDMMTTYNAKMKESDEKERFQSSADDSSGEGILENNLNSETSDKGISKMPLLDNGKYGGVQNVFSVGSFSLIRDPFLLTLSSLTKARNSGHNFSSFSRRTIENTDTETSDINNERSDRAGLDLKSEFSMSAQASDSTSEQHYQVDQTPSFSKMIMNELPAVMRGSVFLPLSMRPGFSSLTKKMAEAWSCLFSGPVEKLKANVGPGVENIVAELVEGEDEELSLGNQNQIPVILDSVHYKGGALMLLAYGDTEPREMDNALGHVKLKSNYGRVHVQVSGNCKMWRSDVLSEDGGWLSTNVYVDINEQKWHANLKIVNLFVPLFERILEIPITWSNGRASGEVHICMSKGETFPNLHGQLDVTGVAFHLYDAPSRFSDVSASLRFRAQRIFLHNASGWFGKVPIEASGDFGIDPEQGEFHLMCQVHLL